MKNISTIRMLHFARSSLRMRATVQAAGALLLLLGVLVPGTVIGQEKARAFYERGAEAFAGKQYKEAIIHLKNALREDPKLLPAHVLTAKVYLQVGAISAARSAIATARDYGVDRAIYWPLMAEALARGREYRELLRVVPESGFPSEAQSKLLVFRGHAHLELGDTDSAETAYGIAAEYAPRSATPILGRIRIDIRRGDLASAQTRVDEAIRLEPDLADVWNAQGEIYHAQGKLEEALSAYTRTLELEDTLLGTRLSRAGILLDLNRLEEAADDIERLKQEAPSDPRIAYLNVILLAKSDRGAEAREALEQASQILAGLDPTMIDRSMQLLMLAGLANYELGAFEQAQLYLNKYVLRAPKQPGARKLLASAMLKNGQAPLAIDVLETALIANPKDPATLTLLAEAYSRNGRPDIAIGYLEKAIELPGDTPRTRTALAVVRAQSGDTLTAIEELQNLFDEDPKQNTRAGIVLATQLMKRGMFGPAIPVLNKLVDIDPDEPNYTNLLGTAELGAGRFEAARKTLSHSLSLDPRNFVARINAAKIDVEEGNFEGARKAYSALLSERPESVYLLLALARLESRLGQLDKAYRHIEKARTTAPNSVDAALALARYYLDTGDAEKALTIAQEAEDRAPENITVLDLVAASHIAMERRDLAATTLQRMARYSNFDVARLVAIAERQSSIGLRDDAIFSLQMALQRDETNVDAQIALATNLLRKRDLDAAGEVIDKLVMEFPDLSQVHLLRGDLNGLLKQPKEATKSFEKAFELSPSTTTVLKVYLSLSRLGERDQARARLNEWLQLNPADTTVEKVLSESHIAAGNFAVARGLLESVLRRVPNDPQALNNLAYVAHKLKDPNAVKLAEQAVKVAPNDPRVLDTFGWLLVLNGDLKRGLAQLRDAHARAESDPEIRYHLGVALLKLNRKTEAATYLRQAASSTRPFDGRAQAIELLEGLKQ